MRACERARAYDTAEV